MLLSILVPVYNERAVVETSLAKVMEAQLPDGVEREIILVDDCSTDGTSAILDRIAAKHPEMRLIHKPVNEGKGAAIRTAMLRPTRVLLLLGGAEFWSNGIDLKQIEAADSPADESLRKTGSIVEVDHPTRGKYLTVGNPIKLSDSETEVKRSPLLGEHTEEVLAQLGYAPAEIELMRSEGVI